MEEAGFARTELQLQENTLSPKEIKRELASSKLQEKVTADSVKAFQGEVAAVWQAIAELAELSGFGCLLPNGMADIAALRMGARGAEGGPGEGKTGEGAATVEG